MTPQGIQPNLSAPNGEGLVSQVFDFSDVCPLVGTSQSLSFSRQSFPDCPSLSGDPSRLTPIYNLLGQQGNGLPASTGVDKNALTILQANLIPYANSPVGCSFNVANIDPTDPNHCYDTAVSPSTYWREELFRIDHAITSKLGVSFRYIHDAWNTTVLTPQWGVAQHISDRAKHVHRPGDQLVGAIHQHNLADIVERIRCELRQFHDYPSGQERARRRGVPA